MGPIKVRIRKARRLHHQDDRLELHPQDRKTDDAGIEETTKRNAAPRTITRMSIMILFVVSTIFILTNNFDLGKPEDDRLRFLLGPARGNEGTVMRERNKPNGSDFHRERQVLRSFDDLLALAFQEKRQLSGVIASSAAEATEENRVLVLSPIGNAMNNGGGQESPRRGYKAGHDNTFTLECTLLHENYPPLMRATFDDGDGYDSLDIRKVRVVYDAAEDLLFRKRFSPTTLVVVVDAFDVVFQKSPLELLDAYDRQPHPIVAGGEPTCWDPLTGSVQSNVSTPFCSLPKRQRDLRDSYYLNSGAYMSTLGTLHSFLDFVFRARPLPNARDGIAPWPGTTNRFNDQAYWSYWYVQYHPLIGLDPDDLTLIANIGKQRRKRTTFLDGDRNGGKFNVQGKTPGILHFPGKGAKDFRVYKAGKNYYSKLCYRNGTDGTVRRSAESKANGR